MSNPWVRFGKLLSPGAKTIVTVTAINNDGSSIVTLRSGDTLRVQGDTVGTGNKAFIQSGRVIGQAPDLPSYGDVTI